MSEILLDSGQIRVTLLFPQVSARSHPRNVTVRKVWCFAMFPSITNALCDVLEFFFFSEFVFRMYLDTGNRIRF